MLLLHALHSLSSAHQWKMVVVHFNHRLRGKAADADEALVRNSAAKLGLRCVAGRADVAKAAKGRGISVEMAGRDLRHQFFARTARKLGVFTVAVAHHADDQVELFFLRLLRGTSSGGLGGMQWTGDSPADSRIALIRPFLDQAKETLRGMAKAAGVAFSEDSTNATLDFARNRIRHKLLPLLKADYQPRLEERVLGLMEMINDDAALSAGLACDWLLAKRRARFGALPASVQRNVIHRQLLGLGCAPDFKLVESLRLNPGMLVAAALNQSFVRGADGMIRHCEMFAGSQIELALASSGGAAVFDSLAIHWDFVKLGGKALERQPNTEYFDAGKVGRIIRLRHWRRGDRFHPTGMTASVKLQDLFANAKIPRDERHRLVVAEAENGQIFWVEGLRISELFKLNAKTQSRLKWHWRRAES